MLLLNGRHGADCALPSWCGALHAATVQRASQLGKERIEAAVHVEGGGEGEQARDLLGSKIVDEAELEHEQVARWKVGERVLERVVELGMPERRVGLVALVRHRLVEVELLGDEVLEATARATRVGRVLARRAAVAAAIEIQTDAPRDDDEPGRHAAAGVVGELLQSAELFGAQMVEHLRVRIHRVVVRAPDGSTDMEDDAAVLRDEGTPCGVRIVGGSRREQRRQGMGEHDHRKTIVGHGA